MDTISVTLLGGGDHACAHYVTKAVKNFKKILINFLVLHIKIKDPIVISLSKKKRPNCDICRNAFPFIISQSYISQSKHKINFHSLFQNTLNNHINYMFYIIMIFRMESN